MSISAEQQDYIQKYLQQAQTQGYNQQQLEALRAQLMEQARQANAGGQPAQPLPTGQQSAQPAAASNAETVGNERNIAVNGCSHGTVGVIVNGSFTLASENHGRPTYKKDSQVNGLDVMLYFWDERDGPDFSGWWFGPAVGGDQVWCYHPSKAESPPTKGWKVPYDGPVDGTFVISKAGAQASSGGHGSRQWQSGQQQQQQQEQMQQHQARNLKSQEEQKTAMAVRRAIQAVKAARPDNFDSLKEALEKMLAEDIQNCGAQQQKLKEEAEMSIEQAKMQVEKVREAEEKRREAAEKAEALLRELEGFVEEAESSCRALQEEAKPLTDDLDIGVEAVAATVEAVNTVGVDAKEKTKACTDFLVAKSAEMKANAGPPQAGDDKLTLQKLIARIMETTKASEQVLKVARGSTAKTVKRASAKKLMDAQDQLFDKFDSDKDGVLSKADAKKFAKSQYDFVLSAEACDAIFSVHCKPPAKGFGKDNFQRLRCAIAIALEKAKDVSRKEARLQKERELEEMKVGLREKVAAALKEAEGLEGSVKNAEDEATPLHSKAADLSADEMAKLADQVDEIIKQAKESVAELRKTVAGISEGVDSHLAFWLSAELKPVNVKMGQYDPRLNKCGMFATRFREDGKKKHMMELSSIESKALRRIRCHQNEHGLKAEDMFGLMDSNKDDKVDEEEFLRFFTVCKSPPKEEEEAKEGEEEKAAEDDAFSEEEQKRLFTYLDEDEESSLPKERITQWLKVYMKVSRETVMTSDVSIKGGETIRRLEPGETVEVLSAPVKEAVEEGGEVQRVRASTVSDSAEGYAEGWVTIEGSQGAKFLVDGGKLFKVIKETVLTGSFSLDSADTKRKVTVGEIIEVREWPKKEESSGLMRMKCRVKTDGVVGWVTTVGNAGTKFVVPK